jgi:uncharacterized repeat protein (TIGR02543 family)
LCITFLGCDMMATLFHGEKPEPPPVTYTVTFNANSASGTPPEARTVNDGTVINLPDKGSMSSTGNIFAGWNESSSGGDTTYSVGASVTVTRNMVFYAQWLDGSTPQFTVTFNANGATGGAAPAPQTVYSGISITVPGQGTLAYSGKTFGGWNTQSNGGGTNYAVGAAFTVTGNVTLYAKWQSEIQYTVTYHANGASGAVPSAQTVDPGTVVTLPGAGSMTYTGVIFAGWNTNVGGINTSFSEGDLYTVNANTTFYAQWRSAPIDPNAVVPPGNNFIEQLAYIRNNAGDGVIYDIVVNNNEYIGSQTVSTMGRNITVYIRSTSPSNIRNIQLEGQGNLFSIDTGLTLRLQNIVLRGHSNNNVPLIVIGDGTLILDSGSKITMNTNAVGNGKCGGVNVNGGILELNDGSEIIKNTVNISGYYTYGGGVYVENGGSVIIRGGTISENTVACGGHNWSFAGYGGGIYITGNSTVTMSGGIISKNSITGTGGAYGGGVYIYDIGSSFIKRPASGSSTSGIIYGGSGGDANISGYGKAIYRDWGSLKQRNSTLGGYDEISTGNDEGWE